MLKDFSDSRFYLTFALIIKISGQMSFDFNDIKIEKTGDIPYLQIVANVLEQAIMSDKIKYITVVYDPETDKVIITNRNDQYNTFLGPYFFNTLYRSLITSGMDIKDFIGKIEFRKSYNDIPGPYNSFCLYDHGLETYNDVRDLGIIQNLDISNNRLKLGDPMFLLFGIHFVNKLYYAGCFTPAFGDVYLTVYYGFDPLNYCQLVQLLELLIEYPCDALSVMKYIKMNLSRIISASCIELAKLGIIPSENTSRLFCLPLSDRMSYNKACGHILKFLKSHPNEQAI